MSETSYVALTLHAFAFGKTPEETRKNLTTHAGSNTIKRCGVVMYRASGEVSVSQIDGSLSWPESEPAPVKISDTRPVKWTLEKAGMHLGKIGSVSAQVSRYQSPLGRAWKVEIDGKMIGETGGDDKDALKRAKAMAERKLKGLPENETAPA
jgi:hypothetical protein